MDNEFAIIIQCILEVDNEFAMSLQCLLEVDNDFAMYMYQHDIDMIRKGCSLRFRKDYA